MYVLPHRRLTDTDGKVKSGTPVIPVQRNGSPLASGRFRRPTHEKTLKQNSCGFSGRLLRSPYASSDHRRLRRISHQGPPGAPRLHPRDIAEKTGRSITWLSLLERNIQPRASKMLIGKIARALETQPEDFIRATQDAA